jgi:hypothetical protein
MELKTVVILLLLCGLGWFGYDSVTKRKALETSQKEVERMQAEHGRTREYPGAPVTAVPVTTTATPPSWFQRRLQERPPLDAPTQRKSEQTLYPTPAPY